MSSRRTRMLLLCLLVVVQLADSWQSTSPLRPRRRQHIGCFAATSPSFFPRGIVSLTLGGFVSSRSTCREASSVDVAVEPRNETLELEVLRDQHRALRLAHHSISTELLELRSRCERAECAHREQTINATQLFHKFESSERLRKRAILEAAELRRNFRDALARIAELEALSVPANKTRAEDRAARIHSRRRSIQNGNPAVFQNGVNDIFERAGIHHQQLHRRAQSSSSPPAPSKKTVAKPITTPPPLIAAEKKEGDELVPLRPRKPVLLIPEYGHRASVVAKARVATFAPPASESINSKLERGSKIYQQLQSELVRRSLGREDSSKSYGSPSTKTDVDAFSDSLFNVNAASMPPTGSTASHSSSSGKRRSSYSTRRKGSKTTTNGGEKESIRDKLSRGSKLYQDLQYDMVKRTNPSDVVAASETTKKTASLSDYYNDAAFYKQQPPPWKA